MQKWLLWTEHQYRLPPVGKAFQELGGKELCAMSEEQFRQRSPLGGDVLHAHLDIWKSGGTRRGGVQPLPAASQGHPEEQLGLDACPEVTLPGEAAPCHHLGSVLNPSPGSHPQIQGELTSQTHSLPWSRP